MTDKPHSVTFEQPLTERVRTFLRLEFLFNQHAHHRQDATEIGTRNTLQSLLDILVVLSRSDLKNEILKELSDQHLNLTKLAAKPGVDPARLHDVLHEISQATTNLQHLTSQYAASALRGNDFLMTVLGRSGVPGGTCAFDLPSYHYWLQQPEQGLLRNLDQWHGEIKPFSVAINLYLRLLRKSVAPQDAMATAGMFVHTPTAPCSLLRVHVDPSSAVYPEISAGKHRFTVRFMTVREINARSQQAMADVAFKMQCCNL